jgi:hypothetical protein
MSYIESKQILQIALMHKNSVEKAKNISFSYQPPPPPPAADDGTNVDVEELSAVLIAGGDNCSFSGDVVDCR